MIAARVSGAWLLAVLAVVLVATDVGAQSALQRCLGIAPGQAPAQKIGPSAATRAYCEQLPAWRTYEQAGERFKAGDQAGAAQLLTSAASAGNPVAQLRLAMLYEAGTGVARSRKDAFSWYQRAAGAGEPASQAELGYYYEAGDVVREDWVEAARWFQRSAEQGWVKGQFALGRAYQFGIGVPLNLQTAIGWYERAAAQGDAQAAYFAKYLQSNRGLDGSSRNAQEQAILGPLLGRTVLPRPPVGVTFHNSAERLAHVRQVATENARIKAQSAWETSRREYEDCRRAARDNCHPPGPRPD